MGSLATYYITTLMNINIFVMKITTIKGTGRVNVFKISGPHTSEVEVFGMYKNLQSQQILSNSCQLKLSKKHLVTPVGFPGSQGDRHGKVLPESRSWQA